MREDIRGMDYPDTERMWKLVTEQSSKGTASMQGKGGLAPGLTSEQAVEE